MSENMPDTPAQKDEVTEVAVPSSLVQADGTDPEPDLSEVDFESLYSAVEQMANLLSDPSNLKNSIREKVEKKALPAEWNDIVEILPNAPLLQRVGEEWHWLFDINANPLQIPEAIAARTAKAAAAGMQPAPPQQGQVAYVEDQIREVNEVNAAIRSFTEERLTLEELGTELRLLPISPTYNSFQLCASSYHAHAGAGPMEQTYTSLTSDKSLIEEYTTRVRESIKAIKRTIFLAEFLGYEKLVFTAPPTQLSKSPTSRLRAEMMRLLATDLEFMRFSAPQIASMLAEFKNEFESNEQAISNEFQKIEPDVSLLDANWISQIQSRMNELYVPTGLAAPSRFDQNWLDLYFLNRAKALILHLRNKQNLKRLSLRDLRVLVSCILPSPGQPKEAPAIYGDPDNIPLLDYADALSATRMYPTETALFFALTLLVKLGFGKQIESFVFEAAGALGEESASDLLDAARANRHAGERVYLVLGGPPEQSVAVGNVNLVRTRKGEGSYAANWRLSRTHAVFPVFAGDTFHVTQPPHPKLNNSSLSGLEISVEIQDEGVPFGSFVGPQTLQGTLGSVTVGKPATLDEAVAVIKKNYAHPA
jgi:hypothetical protein